MILKIYDMNKNPLGFVRKISDLKIESDLDSADKNMSFSYLARTHDIKNEFYIRDETNEYVVKTVNQKDDGTQEITAVMNVEELEGTPVPTFYAKDQSLETAAELILEGTGWSVEIQESLSAKVRTLNMSGTNVYQILKNLAVAYFCEVWFDTLKKVVHYVEEIGEDRGAYFIRGLNLISLDVSSDSTGFYTQIHPVGKDNITIESVNDGKKYLSDFSYSKKVKTYYWKDENYTDPATLKEDAEKKLKEMAEPAESYTASITDLAAQSAEYSMLEYHLGDRITLIDGENGIRKTRRIKKMTEYPLEPEKNTCEISNATPTFEEIQKKIQNAAALVEDLTGNTGIVLGSRVEDFTVVKDGLTMIGGKVSDLEDWKVIASSLITKDGIINTVGEYYATHDDVTEIDQRLATTETMAVQTKDKFNWIVKSGTSSTDFTLTDRTAELIADRINLIGLISFSGLNGDAQGRISGAEQTASNAVSAAENAGSMADAASTAAAEATKIANATNEQVASWCAENDKTLIDGAKIYTKSVTALKINTDDLFSQNLTATNLHVTGNSTVDGNLITSGINAGNITAGTLSADRIDVNGIFAQDITASGTITGAVLKGGTIDGGTITGGTITGSLIYGADYSKFGNFVFTDGSTYSSEDGLSIQFTTKRNNLIPADGNSVFSIFNNGGNLFKVSGDGYIEGTLHGSASSLRNAGINVIGMVASDTVTTWGNLLNSVHFINNESSQIVTDNPSTWGMIFNMAMGSDVHQIWCTQPTGALFHRGGNSAGWSGTWREIVDSSNYAQITGESYTVGSSWKALTPYAGDNMTALGMTGYRYTRLYAASATISTSDECEKNILSGITEPYEKMFMGLTPILYMWKNFGNELKPHDRVHCGLGAQSMYAVAEKCGLSAKTLAAICRDDLTEPTADGRTERWGIAYEELIPLNIHMTQKALGKIENIESSVNELNRETIKIAFLQEQIEQLYSYLRELKKQISERG